MAQEKPIAWDGIVNQEQYGSAKVKVAFLLKEVNYPDMEGDWKYTDWLDQQAAQPDSPDFHKTFANIARWMACEESPDASYLACEDYAAHSGLIAKMAVINIHKGAGGSSSDWEAMKGYARENGEALRLQVEKIGPDILFCGGTYPLAKEWIFPGAKEQCLPCGANYFCWGRTKVVEFVHPAWFTVPRKILFAYFKAVYSDLLAIL